MRIHVCQYICYCMYVRKARERVVLNVFFFLQSFNDVYTCVSCVHLCVSFICMCV